MPAGGSQGANASAACEEHDTGAEDDELWFGQISTSVVGRNHYARHKVVVGEEVSLVKGVGLEVHNAHGDQVGCIARDLRPKVEALLDTGVRLEGIIQEDAAGKGGTGGKGGKGKAGGKGQESKFQLPICLQIYALAGSVDVVAVDRIVGDVKKMPRPVVWAPPNEGSGRTYLNVPFEKKDDAKALGAWFDGACKKWYVRPGYDTTPFRRWLLSGGGNWQRREKVYAELHVVKAPCGGIRVVDLDAARWKRLPGVDDAPSRPALVEKNTKVVNAQELKHSFKRFFAGRVAYDRMPCAEVVMGLQPPLLEHQRKALSWLRDADRPRTVAEASEMTPMACFWKRLPSGDYQHALTNHTVTAPPELPRGGLFADEMGLGKTQTVVALLLTARPDSDRNLIVCPSAVVAVWREHAEAAGLPCSVQGRGAEVAGRAGVVIVTYDTLAHDYKKHPAACGEDPAAGERGENADDGAHQEASTSLFRTRWDRVVLDEAHCIRSRATIRSRAVCSLRAGARFCVTGTPIINSIGDLFPLVRFLRIEPINRYDVWRRLFTRKHPETLERINLLLRAFVLRRTKAMGFLELPARRVEVVRVALSPEEQRMHDLLFEQVAKRAKVAQDPSKTLAQVLRLRQLCTTVAMLPRDWVEALRGGEADISRILDALGSDVVARLRSLIADHIGDDCPICFDPLEEEDDSVCATLCGHLFHRPCIEACLEAQPLCPTCRRATRQVDLVSPHVVAQWRPDSGLSSKLHEAVKVIAHRLSLPEASADHGGNHTVKAEAGSELEGDGKTGTETGRKKAKGERRKAKHSEKQKKALSMEENDTMTPKNLRKSALRKGSEKASALRDVAAASSSCIPREESEQGEIWRNVGGKKIAILVGRDVTGATSGEHIQRHAAFRVAEVVPMPGGVHKEMGHVYLRLADGRGWVSSRSRKDLQKVVATRLGEEPESWRGGAISEEEPLDGGTREEAEPVQESNEGKGENRKTQVEEDKEHMKEESGEEGNRQKRTAGGVVVFSHFLLPMRVLAAELARLGVACGMLRGGMMPEQRSHLLQDFKDAKLQVLLCSLKSASVGVSLTTADTVVVLEPGWSQALEDQAIDRVHRLGQTRDVQVLRLVAKDSVEERMLVRQEQKDDEASGAFAPETQGKQLDSLMSILGVATTKSRKGKKRTGEEAGLE